MTDLNVIEMYPYTYCYLGEKTILIWQTSELDGDSFRINESGKLLSAISKKEFRNILGHDFDKVNWSEETEIDFDKFWTSLTNLRVNRASSQETCERLLNGWNFIEDMLRTFSLNYELKLLKTPILNNAYKKIFSGNNLASVTIEGKSYSPLWTKREIKIIRSAFRSVWSSLTKFGLIKN